MVSYGCISFSLSLRERAGVRVKWVPTCAFIGGSPHPTLSRRERATRGYSILRRTSTALSTFKSSPGLNATGKVRSTK